MSDIPNRTLTAKELLVKWGPVLDNAVSEAKLKQDKKQEAEQSKPIIAKWLPLINADRDNKNVDNIPIEYHGLFAKIVDYIELYMKEKLKIYNKSDLIECRLLTDKSKLAASVIIVRRTFMRILPYFLFEQENSVKEFYINHCNKLIKLKFSFVEVETNLKGIDIRDELLNAVIIEIEKDILEESQIKIKESDIIQIK